MEILRSKALAKAFENLAEFPREDTAARPMIFDILKCLQRIKFIIPHRANPDALVTYPTSDSAWNALVLLCKARDELARFDRAAPFNYSLKLERIMGTIIGDSMLGTTRSSFFDPKNLHRKGGAAKNRKGAFNTMAILELAEHVPAKAPKRATAIAELLALVDIHVTPPNVLTGLKRARP